MKKDKILMIISSATYGGGQTHLYSLCHALKDDFDFVVVCSDDGPLNEDLREIGVKVIYRDIQMMKAKLGIKVILQLYRIIRYERPNLVHLHGTRSAMLGIIAARISRVPKIIYTVHGFSFNQKINWIMRYFYRTVEKIIALLSDLVITVSYENNNSVVSRGIIPFKKVITIYNGIDTKRFNRNYMIVNKDELLRGFNIDTSKKVVGTVARFDAAKGLRFLILAANRILAKRNDISFLIVGDGPLREEIVNLIDTLGIGDKVILAGQRKDIPDMLNLMDIFVLPSLHEGLPIVLLEALAMSRPIVATGVNGSLEIIKDEKNGLIVPPGDVDALERAILRLIDDPSLRKRLAYMGPEFVHERFSLERMILRTRDVYERILKDRDIRDMSVHGLKIGMDARKINDYGIGTYIQNILKDFSNRNDGHRYFLFCHLEEYNSYLVDSHNFIRVADNSPKYSIRELFALSFKMRRFNLDLFHAPHYVTPFFRPCKTVVTIHDVIHLLFPEYLPSKVAYYYAKFMLRFAARSARKIITVSESSKKDIVSYLGVSPEKVVVIYNAVDKNFTPMRERQFSKLLSMNFHINGDYILYVGSLMKHKNVEGLLRAFGLLSQKKDIKDSYKLVIVGGKRNQIDELRKIGQELGIDERIIYCGFLGSRWMPVLYNGASLFVFPSFYEGFGIPPLEAMACGVPVITSNTSSLPEVVGDAGILVDPFDIEGLADDIYKVLSDGELRREMSWKGIERARMFSWEKTVKETLRVYEEVCS